MRKLVAILSLLAVTTACDRAEDEAPAPGGADSAPADAMEGEEPAQEPETMAETSTETDWLRVSEDARNQAQSAQFDRAQTARKALGQTLLEALTTSVGENDFVGSIAFCKERAPEIADRVGDTYGVKIGRTAAKLRNPSNTGPAWVANAVDSEMQNARAFAGPNGELGVVAPISTAKLCTNCHGTADDIDPRVVEALDEHYPDDRARGFAEGDLRGWFWVEVPPPS